VLRAFLDANVLFSAAYREDAGVRRLWGQRSVALLSSTYAIEEARRNLGDPGMLQALDDLLSGVETVEAGPLPPELRGKVTLPEKDWPIVAGAIAADATHLITGDLKDFGPYFGREILGILVLPPRGFLELLSR